MLLTIISVRALIDEVDLIRIEISEEPNGGLTRRGPRKVRKRLRAGWRKGTTICCFDARTPLGSNLAVRQWLSYLLQPANLLYHAGEQ